MSARSDVARRTDRREQPMIINRTLMLTFLIGSGLGAIGATAIVAQGRTPPAYFISEATIKDADLYRKFLSMEPPNADFGGHQLVRGGRVVAIKDEPAPAPRIAIVAFDSVEAAQRWVKLTGHVDAMKLYHQAADGHTFIVEGVAP
jgi:uncharacterized protein (DUF1330 family)